ncbi:hypothetical protein [Aequorivita capsosiphonis]|uniref:hypothetical protein n=1 Tax=Aequorivita capsosiphonis TaxID=487317 RepID=UPI000410B55A|nr:hypothetical protein [Aequorivita capsosiphonis]
MKIKLLLIAAFHLLIISSSFSQSDTLSSKERMILIEEMIKNRKGNPSIGYYLTTKDERIDMYSMQDTEETILNMYSYSDYALTAERLFYHNEKGKVIKVKQRKVSELFVGNNYYTRLKIGSKFGLNRLHQVIVQNDKYVLTEYFSHSSFYYYLYDKKNDNFIYKKKRAKNNTKDDVKFAKKYLKPYFKNCSEFIIRLDENLSKEYKKIIGQGGYSSDMMEGISNLECE